MNFAQGSGGVGIPILCPSANKHTQAVTKVKITIIFKQRALTTCLIVNSLLLSLSFIYLITHFIGTCCLFPQIYSLILNIILAE